MDFMPRHRWKRVIWPTLLLSVLLTAGIWFGFNPLLNTVLRPSLAVLLGKALGAEIAAQHIELDWRGLAVRRLHLTTSSGLAMETPLTRVSWTWPGLLFGHLARLDIEEPSVQFNIPMDNRDGTTPAHWSGPPIVIEQICISRGRLDLAVGERTFLFQDLAFSGGLGLTAPLVLAARIGPEKVPLVLQGEVTLTETLQMRLDELSWAGTQLVASPLEAQWSPGSDSGLAGKIGLSRFDSTMLRRWLDAFSVNIPETPDLSWQLSDAVGDLAVEDNRLEVTLAGRQAEILMPERSFTIENIALHVSGWEPEWQVEGRCQMGGEIRVSLQGQSDPDGWGLQGSIQADEVALANGRMQGSHLGFEAKITPAGLSIEDWRAETAWTGAGLAISTLRGRGSATVSRGDIALEVTDMSTAGIDFLNADGLAGWNGGRLSLSGTGTWRASAERAFFAVRGKAQATEALWGPVYVELADLDSAFELAGEYDASGRRLVLERGVLDIPGVGGLAQSGEIGLDTAHLTGSFTLPDLDGPLLSSLIRSAGSQAMPMLRGVSLHGRIDGDTDIVSENGCGRITATLRPAAVEFTSEAGLSLEGMRGVFPMRVQWGERDTPLPDQPLAGRLVIDRLHAGPLELTKGEWEITAVPNQWYVQTPMHFEMAGGALLVQDLTTGWSGENPLFSARIRLEEIDLARLTTDLRLPPMAGSLKADLGTIRYQSGMLASKGNVDIDVFGGHLRMYNIQYQDPLSPYATLHADIDFSGLDLQQLTQTLAFGEMNGTLHGYIHDLRLFSAVPSGFDARIESLETGKRNISVKALNNLSVLSQGALTKTLSQGVYRFIDFYRYRKIGLLLHLENDVFTLRGTALPGSDRYLVSGSTLPPRIDIVAPETAISFKQMLKRLRRLDRTGRSGD
jgi:hypothetical protein